MPPWMEEGAAPTRRWRARPVLALALRILELPLFPTAKGAPISARRVIEGRASGQDALRLDSPMPVPVMTERIGLCEEYAK